jgi:hypothetical protein
MDQAPGEFPGFSHEIRWSAKIRRRKSGEIVAIPSPYFAVFRLMEPAFSNFDWCCTLGTDLAGDLG